MFINQAIKRLIPLLSLLGMVILLNACGSDSDAHKRLDTLTANARVTDARDYLYDRDDQPIVYMGDVVTLDGASSRSHVDILSYSWSQTAGTPATLTAVSETASTFTVPASGEILTFELEVVDAQGMTDIDSVDITAAVPVALSANTSSTIDICAPIDSDDC